MHKMGKTPCCDKNGLKKGPWTAEEDQKLIDYIHEHGHGRWRTLPKYAGLQRCGKSCRLRWTNYLRPDIKRGKFSMEEEETIIQLHTILGNKWSAIAARLPGRTDNEIKNYWNTHIRKRLLRMGIDPLTHGPLLELSSPAVGPIYFQGPSSYEDHNNVPSSSNGIVLNEVLQQQPFSNLSNLSSSNSELIPQFFPQTLHHQQQNQMITFPITHLQLPLSFQNLSSQDFQGRNATFSSSNASSSSSSSAHPFSICNGRSEVQQFSNPSNAVLNMDNDVSYSSCLTAQNVSFPPYHNPTPSYNHIVFESSAAANNMMVGSDFGFSGGGSSLSSNMSYFNSSSSDRAPSSFNGRTTPADATTDPYCNDMMVFDHYL